MVALNKIGVYAIALIAGAIILGIIFGPSQIFSIVKGSSSNLSQLVPNVSAMVGIDEQGSSDVIVPEANIQKFKNLNNAIETMKGKKQCVSNYGGFTNLGGTSIEIGLSEKSLVAWLMQDGRKSNHSFKIEDLKPCVIAGSEEITENFYEKYENKPFKNDIKGYFASVDRIKIKEDDRTGCLADTRFMLPGYSDDIVNDECDNLEDGGKLFTPDGKYICFFPTNFETDADEDGLENSFVQGLQIDECT